MKSLTKTTLLLMAVFLFAGCLKDKTTYTYTLLKPVYKNKAEVISEIGSKTAQPLRSPGKIFIYGNYLFVNEINKGVHIIDNSNPRQPVNKAFINIPGNLDIAVKGNIMYADIYSDMLSIDISDPLSIRVKHIVRNVFPERNYGNGFLADSSQYIVDWTRKDTTVSYAEYSDARSLVFQSASFSSSAAASATTGIAGSMARFCLRGDYMYAVNSVFLKVFEINNPELPASIKDIPVAGGLETIYPFADKLFRVNPWHVHL